MITNLVKISGFDGTVDFSDQAEALTGIAYELERRVKALPQVPLKVVHKFADGLYYREIFIPAGAALTGRIHRQADLNIIYFGAVEVLSENGVRLVEGPCSFPGRSGVKQFGLAQKDTLWATVHATHLTDLAEIERALFEDEPHAFDFVTGEVLPCLLH